MKRKILVSIFVCFVVTSWGQSHFNKELIDNITKESIKDNLYFLAGEKCEGRMIGTPGDSIASDYVEKWMRKYELVPGVEKKYKQSMEFVENLVGTDEFLIDGKNIPMKDFVFYYSRSYAIKKGVEINNAPLVFINYGISSKNYDDFDNIDVKDKVVINLGGAHSFIKDSLFSGSKFDLSFKDYDKKGALAALYLPVTSNYDNYFPLLNESYRKVYALKDDTTSYFAQDKNPFPDMMFSQKLARELLGNRSGVIDTLLSNIEYLKNDPKAFELNKKISIHIKRKISNNIFSDNIIGCIKGTDINAGYVLIIAHRDHIGKTESGVLYGADDNASGTVAIMECMKAISLLSKKGIKPKRTIIFASLTGEEQGFCGAQYYAEHSTVPLDKIKYVINIDMLGRIDNKHLDKKAETNNYLYPIYSDTMYNFKPVLDNVSKQTGVYADDYYYKNPNEDDMINRSDHIIFGEKGIPFVWLFSGLHNDYHTEKDNVVNIDYDLLTERTKFSATLLWSLSNN